MTIHAPSLTPRSAKTGHDDTTSDFQIGPFSIGDMSAGVLAFLVILGLAAGVGRLLIGMGHTTALTDLYPWGIWIGFDFALIAFSGVGFTMAFIVHVLHLHRFQPALRPAILAGLFGYVAVLMLLLLDLGRPDRFYNFMLHYNLHSPLFEICWCVLLYTTILVLEVSPDALARLPWKWPLKLVYRIMTPVTIIGVTLSTLHQSTLGTLYLNMPHRLHALWYTPILPLLFYISSILAGLGLGIVAYKVAVRVQGKREDDRIALGLGKGIVWMATLYLLARVGEVVLAGELPQLLTASKLSRLWFGELFFSALLPIALFGLPRVARQGWVSWVAPISILIGVGMNRFNATLAAQLLPENAAYLPSLLEWASTVGILAAGVLGWYLAVRFLMDSAIRLGYEGGD